MPIKKLDAEERALISPIFIMKRKLSVKSFYPGLTESNAKVKLHRIKKIIYTITEAEMNEKQKR